MTDDELACDVSEELRRDTRLDRRAIGVSVLDGVVTLRGTVGSPRAKHAAARAARRVRGVLGLDDRLEVRPLDTSRRDDADLRGDVLQALMHDSRVPGSVDATVRDGIVTLTGLVTQERERDDAEIIANAVPGVVAVDNHVTLDRPAVRPSAEAIGSDIRTAFLRNAGLDADNIGVTTSDGTVRLSGTVRSSDQLEAAVAAALDAPGVTEVDNQLEVGF